MIRLSSNTDTYSDDETQGSSSYNIQFQSQKGDFGKGVVNNLKGIYLNLTWEGNETGSQEVLIDFVNPSE